MSVERLITDNIDIWTSALKTKSASGRGSSKKLDLYGIKKLRELILELAVRGKLVPQDPNDEPASVLLERIAEEKAKLVKDKKIKKPKKWPEITENEKPFNLPQSWTWCYLNELGSIVGGGTPKSGEPSYWCENGIKWLTPADLYGLNKKYISSGKRDITEEGLAKSSAQLMSKGAILFSSRAPIGYVAIASSPLATNQGFKSVVPFLSGLSDYIYYYLKRSGRYIDAAASGTTFKEVSGTIVSKVLTPLPPQKEQHRIVAKVDELMTLCDQLEQQTETSIESHKVLVETLLATLTNSADADELMQNWARISEHFDTLFTTEHSIDQLKQTILQLAVNGVLVPFGETKETELKSILSFGPRNGFSPKEVPFDTQVKVLKLGATSYGNLNLDESKFVSVAIENKPHLPLRKGDILIQRGNSANFVGSNVLIDRDYPNYIYPDLMMKIRLNDEVIPEFISLLLSSIASRQHMWSQMTGTSGTMPKISKKVVESIPIRFPLCKETQQRVVKQYNVMKNVSDKITLKISVLKTAKLTLADAIVERRFDDGRN